MYSFQCLLPRPKHALIQRVHEYWSSKRAGRIAPRRRDIDPIELGPALLPFLTLLTVPAGRATPERIIVDLMGTGVAGALGRDGSRKPLAELDGGDLRAAILAVYGRTVDDREPQFAEECVYSTPRGVFVFYERGLFPLSDDGVTINRLLGCQVDGPMPSAEYAQAQHRHAKPLSAA
jgi:hypothetical protein